VAGNLTIAYKNQLVGKGHLVRWFILRFEDDKNRFFRGKTASFIFSLIKPFLG
jgi:hypothetical protein